MSKSKSGDLRLNSTSTIHHQQETLELFLIIRPMGLMKVDLLISRYHIINQKIIEKRQDIKLAK